ncbi:hypothetical protein PtB15_6B848 [Puccinia triticina]|nr:hypothetical protein PtB15_6B848 [Puccinia triticina]
MANDWRLADPRRPTTATHLYCGHPRRPTLLKLQHTTKYSNIQSFPPTATAQCVLIQPPLSSTEQRLYAIPARKGLHKSFISSSQLYSHDAHPGN